MKSASPPLSILLLCREFLNKNMFVPSFSLFYEEKRPEVFLTSFFLFLKKIRKNPCMERYFFQQENGPLRYWAYFKQRCRKPPSPSSPLSGERKIRDIQCCSFSFMCVCTCAFFLIKKKIPTTQQKSDNRFTIPLLFFHFTFRRRRRKKKRKNCSDWKQPLKWMCSYRF